MKYVITCRYCNNGYMVEENGKQEFFCPTCGGANNLENAVAMDDNEKIDAAVENAMQDFAYRYEQDAIKNKMQESIALFIIAAIIIGVISFFGVITMIAYAIDSRNNHYGNDYSNYQIIHEMYYDIYD